MQKYKELYTFNIAIPNKDIKMHLIFMIDMDRPTLLPINYFDKILNRL